jgi:hypothetical protein
MYIDSIKTLIEDSEKFCSMWEKVDNSILKYCIHKSIAFESSFYLENIDVSKIYCSTIDLAFMVFIKHMVTNDYYFPSDKVNDIKNEYDFVYGNYVEWINLDVFNKTQFYNKFLNDMKKPLKSTSEEMSELKKNINYVKKILDLDNIEGGVVLNSSWNDYGVIIETPMKYVMYLLSNPE